MITRDSEIRRRYKTLRELFRRNTSMLAVTCELLSACLAARNLLQQISCGEHYSDEEIELIQLEICQVIELARKHHVDFGITPEEVA